MTLVGAGGSVRLHAEVEGAGPPVALLHGWAFDHRVWAHQAEVLRATGHQVIRLDLRGHGLSPKPEGSHAIATLAGDVIATLRSLQTGPVVLIGWSLGGVTAFRVALDAPELLSGLVLVGSNGVATSRQAGYPFGVAAEAHAPALVAAELADHVAARRRLVRGAFAEDPGDDAVERLLALTSRTPPRSGAATLQALLHADQVADVTRMRVDVEQIIGSADPVFSRRGAAWLAERLPGLRQTVLDGCGHYPMIEAPAAFDIALADAVERLTGSVST